MSDLISRQAAINAANKLVDRFEQILRDIRETNEDDSVCGMCEYDGAFVGQSGDWCNECPGFDKADCFKLSDEQRKVLITATYNEMGIIIDTKAEEVVQPELIRCRNCKYYCGRSCTAHDMPGDYLTPDDFCSWAQPKKRKG